MSSLYVRSLVRQWLLTYPQVPFYDSINYVPTPEDNVWLTVEFFADAKEGTMGCDGYRETGLVDLIFASQPGIGDVPLLTLLEPAVAFFEDQKDPSNRLTLTESEPVRDVSGGTADRTYRMAVGVNYSYSV